MTVLPSQSAASARRKLGSHDARFFGGAADGRFSPPLSQIKKAMAIDRTAAWERRAVRYFDTSDVLRILISD